MELIRLMRRTAPKFVTSTSPTDVGRNGQIGPQLAWNPVLLFRGQNLDDQQLMALARNFGN